MSYPPLSPVQRQITRVSRRLFLQRLLNHLGWWWAGALAATAVWFLLHPLLVGPPEVWFRWTLLGSALGVATIAAALMAWWRAPSNLTAALALDEKFDLKERVTTSVGLTLQEATSSAGQALLADVNQRVHALKVPERFPLRLSKSAALVPLGAVLLTLVALLYDPALGTATTGEDSNKSSTVSNAPEIQKQLDNLKKAPRAWPKDDLKSDKLKEIEAAWDKLVNKPLDPNNQEQVRERVQAIRELEEKMKDRLDGLKAQADQARALKQHLGKLAQSDQSAKAGLKDGPAKQLQDALAKGDTAKAREEIERLMKKIQEEKLKPEEQKQLADDLEKLEKQLQRLADRREQEERLRRDHKQGKIDQNQLQRELNQLAEEAQDLEMLNDLALDLQECQACLRGGDRKGAREKLARLLGHLEQLDLDEQQMKELRDAQCDLQEAREGLCQCLNGECDGTKNGLGKKSRRPGTLRPIAPDAPTDAHDARQRAEVDPLGKQRISGFTRGGTFNKVPAREVGGVFRQAVQDAPEAIERQRVPQDAAEMLKGYYENLGGQKR
jgi:uncharacterized coiled-coil DUF342 family protein